MSDPQTGRHLDELVAGMGAVLAQAREALDDADRLSGLADQIGALNQGPLATLVSAGGQTDMTEAHRSALNALADDIARLEAALAPRLGLVQAFGGYLRSRTAEA